MGHPPVPVADPAEDAKTDAIVQTDVALTEVGSPAGMQEGAGPEPASDSLKLRCGTERVLRL